MYYHDVLHNLIYDVFFIIIISIFVVRVWQIGLWGKNIKIVSQCQKKKRIEQLFKS